MCMRAKVTLKVAREKLDQAKSHLKSCMASGEGIPQAQAMVKEAEKLYQQALAVWKKVSFAKKETRIALKKYETIVARAKEMEKKAIEMEQKVQNARQVVTKAERIEYITRKCKRKPRNLTSVEKKVVKTLRTQVTHITRKHTSIVKKI